MCVLKMNQRWYGGRQLEVGQWDGITDFQVEETDQERDDRLKKWENFIKDEEEGKDEEQQVVSWEICMKCLHVVVVVVVCCSVYNLSVHDIRGMYTVHLIQCTIVSIIIVICAHTPGCMSYCLPLLVVCVYGQVWNHWFPHNKGYFLACDLQWFQQQCTLLAVLLHLCSTCCIWIHILQKRNCIWLE